MALQKTLKVQYPQLCKTTETQQSLVCIPSHHLNNKQPSHKQKQDFFFLYQGKIMNDIVFAMSMHAYASLYISLQIQSTTNPSYLMSKHKQLYTKNPWHCVSYGPKAPQIVNAIIEIPAESKVKYELDKESGLLKLDRILFSAVHYPHNYGFIPQTYCDDHDPLDILVICSAKVEPLCLVEAKVIGVMRMLDQGEGDDKIIAVANNDMSVSHYTDIKELPEHLLQQVHRFFEDYKKMEKKKVEVLEFLGHQEAWRIVEESIKLYQKDFGGEEKQ